jgi:hypothetical protein
MALIRIPKPQLERLRIAKDLFEQAKTTWERRANANANDRTTAEYNHAVHELLFARLAVAETVNEAWIVKRAARPKKT